MARVLTKKSTVAAKVPLATDLEIGELAVNTADAKLYTKHSDNTVKQLGIATTDSRLTDAREWTASTVTQVEAEAGTATTRRAWTAQRVFQAIAAWWAASAMKTKLDGIAPNATANQTDAYLLDRANHTGTQASTTISDFAEAVQDVMGATLVQGANVTITYDDVANTITIAAAGGGGTAQPWSTVESLAASKTLALADAGKYLRCTDAVTVTVPPQSSVAWEANTEIHFEQAAAGAVTFTAGAGVTINKPASLNAVTAEQYVAVTLKRVAADTWTLIGALEVTP